MQDALVTQQLTHVTLRQRQAIKNIRVSANTFAHTVNSHSSVTQRAGHFCQRLSLRQKGSGYPGGNLALAGCLGNICEQVEVHSAHQVPLHHPTRRKPPAVRLKAVTIHVHGDDPVT